MTSLVKHNNWCYLLPGDIVDIVAPAFKFDQDAFHRAIKIIENQGLVPRYPKNLMGKSLLFSNKEEIRWRHFKNALLAKDSKVIWCTRGGYGSNHLLPHLDKLNKKLTPKMIVGYSDITSLHYYFNSKYNWTTLHGSLIESLGKSKTREKDIQETFHILSGYKQDTLFKKLTPINEAAKVSKIIKAEVVGGNLSVLCSHLATPWQFSLKGKFLFLEDIGERGYRIDKMLFQMQHSGFLTGVKAILLGDFTGGYEVSGRALAMPTIKEFFLNSKIPVFKGMPCGHDVKKAPLLLGAHATLNFAEKTLKIINNGFHEEAFVIA